MLLIVTLICVCLGVAVPFPGLGILMAIVAVPSLFMVARKTRQQMLSEPTSAMDKMFLFFQAEAVVLVVFLSASVAFAAVCIPAGVVAFGPIGSSSISFFLLIAGVFFGIVLAVFVGRRVFKNLWSK